MPDDGAPSSTAGRGRGIDTSPVGGRTAGTSPVGGRAAGTSPERRAGTPEDVAGREGGAAGSRDLIAGIPPDVGGLAPPAGGAAGSSDFTAGMPPDVGSFGPPTDSAAGSRDFSAGIPPDVGSFAPPRATGGGGGVVGTDGSRDFSAGTPPDVGGFAPVPNGGNTDSPPFDDFTAGGTTDGMPGDDVTDGFAALGGGSDGSPGDKLTAGFGGQGDVGTSTGTGGPGGGAVLGGGAALGGGTVVGLKRTPRWSSGSMATTVGESKSGPFSGEPKLLVGGAFVAIVGISSWGVISVGGASLSVGRAGSVTQGTLAHQHSRAQIALHSATPQGHVRYVPTLSGRRNETP